MTLPAATLDHVVINARDDMDRAADIYRRLGFTLTERGYHSLGSINHLAMFGTDYLELIAVPKGATTGRMDLLDLSVRPERPGVRLGGLRRHLRRRSPRSACRSIRRSSSRGRCKVAGKEHDARFRTVRMKAGVVPYGRVYYCHHFTRELVWRDEWRHHANGTVAVVRALIVEPDPAAGAKLYADMFGVEGGARHQGRQERGDRQFALRHRHRGRAQGRSSATPCPTPRGARPTWPGLTFRTVSVAEGGTRRCKRARSRAWSRHPAGWSCRPGRR